MKRITKPKTEEIQTFVGSIDDAGRLQLPNALLQAMNCPVPGPALIESDGICLLITPMPLREASA